MTTDTSAAISTMTADELPVSQMYGDLSTPPPPEKRLFVQETFALTWLRSRPGVTEQEKSAIDLTIADRTEMLIQELANAPARLNARIHREVHHQLRARPDMQTGQLAVEQWVPALGYWLVCGFFPSDVDYSEVIAQLRVGDPRYKTPTERLEETREEAKAKRAEIDAAHADKVTGTISNMSNTQIKDFLAVERALKTGETVIAHGPDLAYVEGALDKTKKAAAAGDRQAQSTLDRGVRDTNMCENPGHNPLVR